MLRICYMSFAATPMDDGGVDAILDHARLCNERDGITGLLLYDGEGFIQAIEGPAGATAACYGRIHNDARHHDIRLLGQEAIEAREFGDWTMSYRWAGAQDATTFLNLVRQDVAQVRDPYLQMLFTGFAARRR